MPDWDPDVDVTPELARRLIDGSLPELAGRPLAPVAVGWDNAVFVVDDAWIVRIPRRAVAVPGVEREIAVLPRLAPRLPLPVPIPTYVGRGGDGYPAWPFFAAPLIPGREPAHAALDDGARAALAEPLAAFLRELHAPELAAELGEELPVDPMRRADMTVRVPMARARLAEAAAAEIVDLRAEAGEVLVSAAKLPPGRPTAVAHGDLHLRHLLVGARGGATGVIDWGDLCRADPSIDLVLAWGLLPAAARPAFRAAYGPIDEAGWLRARLLSLFLSVVLAVYGRATGNAALEGEAVAAARRTLVG
jgi:aminoglycoside phosphotransferase (APT) family kinase protein